MDGERFDALTRALSAARSRRGMLAAAGGALATALLAGGAGAAPEVGASCSSDADCIDGRCVNGHCRFGGTQPPCADELRSCLAQAKDAFTVARRACEAGPRQALGACVTQASATQAAAMATCAAGCG